jgi:hypothetical protein
MSDDPDIWVRRDDDVEPALAGAAFAALREENLIPPSRYHPYLAVGRDYEGGVLRGLAGV